MILLEGGDRDVLLGVERLVAWLRSMTAWSSCDFLLGFAQCIVMPSSVFSIGVRLRSTAHAPCSVLPLPAWCSSGWSSVVRWSAPSASPMAAGHLELGFVVATLLFAGAALIEPG